MSENKNIKVLTEFTETMKRIGIDKTIMALRNARSINEKDPDIAFIIELVCNHFSLEFSVIIEEKGTQDKYTYCRAFIIFYLTRIFKVTWPDMRILFKRDQSNLYRTAKFISDLDCRLQHHKPYCEMKQYFDERIKKYKKAN